MRSSRWRRERGSLSGVADVRDPAHRPIVDAARGVEAGSGSARRERRRLENARDRCAPCSGPFPAFPPTPRPALIDYDASARRRLVARGGPAPRMKRPGRWAALRGVRSDSALMASPRAVPREMRCGSTRGGGVFTDRDVSLCSIEGATRRGRCCGRSEILAVRWVVFRSGAPRSTTECSAPAVVAVAASSAFAVHIGRGGKSWLPEP
jgi:hypothetical protein